MIVDEAISHLKFIAGIHFVQEPREVWVIILVMKWIASRHPCIALDVVPSYHGIMGRRFPDGGLLRYRKWVPQQLGDVNKQGSGDSWPIGARHGDTAANHTDLQSRCGRTCVFAVRVWSNLWDLIWLRTSHYSMIKTKIFNQHKSVKFPSCWWQCHRSHSSNVLVSQLNGNVR